MSAGAAPRTILVVDDNEALVDNLREILEDAGYRVRSAGSCAGARAAGAFDLALVDVRLPDGDGLALAAELKALAPDAEVILLTGFATLESAVAAVRAGAWDYLVKPCATDALLHAVRRALAKVALVEDKRLLAQRASVAEKLASAGRLAAGLSHEIRNPLNAASLQLTVLERRLQKLPPESRPPLVEPLALVQSEIRRLNQVLEDFLQLARPRELLPQPVDLEAIAGAVLDLLAPQAERGGVRLERRFEASPSVLGDGGRLQQAVMNLALNAIQATPSGGTVAIAIRGEGASAVLAVEDTGPGVPEAVRARVFDPFFTTKEAGSGLGLPLVQAVALQHGGTIAIEDRPGGGARFVLRLPSAR